MRIKKVLLVLLVAIIVPSCKKDNPSEVKSDLEEYIASYYNLNRDFLIACAAGNNFSFMGSSEKPISIFYYKKDGISNIQIFETTSSNFKDYSTYDRVELTNENLFNGRMGRFLSPSISESKWYIVTYISANSLHVSDPIQIKSAIHPTQDITQNINVAENQINPSFDWQNDNVDGNVIYFSLISDFQETFISGIYTSEKNWTFYDLTNVTLNVTPTESPILLSDTAYIYTHMGVDSENWVRSFGSKTFSTK